MCTIYHSDKVQVRDALLCLFIDLEKSEIM
jgi:hypothetical protein